MALRYHILKFYAYKSLSSMGVLTPFLILYLLDQNISYTAIAVGASTMAITTVVSEVPSGYVGDRFGRRTSILLSKAVAAVGTSLWFFVESILLLVGINFLSGLSQSLRSGSDTAWLHDILDEHNATERYTEIESRGNAISHWTYGVTAIVGAGMYFFNRVLPFVVAAVFAWAAVYVVYTFPSNAQYRAESDEKGSPISVARSASLTASFLSKREARPLILLGAVNASAVYAGSQFIQPLVANSQSGGLPIHDVVIPSTILLGLLYAALSVISGFTIDRSDWLEDTLGTASAVVIVYLVGGVALASPWLSPLFIIPAIIVFRAIPPMAAPIRNAYLHKHADSAGRATEMSAISFLFAISRVPVLLVVGRVADVLSAKAAFSGLGLYVIAAVVLIVSFDRPLTSVPEP